MATNNSINNRIVDNNLAVSQSVSSDAISFNMGIDRLENYETGTFAPTISFDGNSVGITYSVNTGRYTRIGNTIFLSAEISLTNKGTSTGVARIDNLPYAPNIDNIYVSSIYVSNVSLTSAFDPIQLVGSVFAAGIEFHLVTTTIYEVLTDAAFANNSSVLSSIIFFI